MNIKEKIEIDTKEALKKGDAFVLSVLRMLGAAFQNKTIDKKTKLFRSGKETVSEVSLTDEEIIDVLTQEAKKRREASSEYEKASRHDAAQKEKKELEIIMAYLPEQLSEKEVEEKALEIIKNLGASGIKDFGKVMKAASAEMKGKASGEAISSAVKKLLG